MNRSQLQAASKLVLTGELEGALALLLETWRQRKARPLADAIERLSSTLPVSEPRLLAAKKKEGPALWRQLEERKESSDLPVLLATWSVGTIADAASAVRALIARGVDPRTTSVLTRALASPPWGSLTAIEKIWGPVVAYLSLAGDSRSIDVLAPALASPALTGKEATAWYRDNVGPLIEGLRHRPEFPLSAEESELVASLVQTLPAVDSPVAEAAQAPRVVRAKPHDPKLEAALLAKVLESPFDDGPRAVYADFLMERGDVRGEFIHLQLKEANGEASPKHVARAKSLLDKHFKEWMGEHSAVLHKSECVFRRGFLAHAVVGKKMSSKDLIARAVDSPLLDTLESFELGGHRGDFAQRLRSKPHAHALRVREVSSPEVLSGWAALKFGLPLERLTLANEAVSADCIRQLDAVRAPSLKALQLQVSSQGKEQARALVQALGSSKTVTQRLEQLEVIATDSQLSTLGPYLDPSLVAECRLKELVARSGAATVTVPQSSPSAPTLKLHVAVSTSPVFPQVPALLEAMPKGFKLLELQRAAELIVSATSAAILQAAQRYGGLKVIWPAGSV